MLEYDFMRHAFAAGGVVAVLAGVVGFFLVMRRQTFAAHALSHVGFAGASGAVLLGVSPFTGMLSVTLLGGMAMGALGQSLQGADIAIGAVLSLALGLGMLFLHFYTAYATQVNALLFGNVLGVATDTLWILSGLGVGCLGVLAIMSRPLIFASLQPELAEAKGVSLRLISILFLSVVAVTTAECIQIVGVLLVFTLMVCPAAAAQRLTTRIGPGIALSVVLAVAQAWLGIMLAYYTDWPTSFWITALSVGVYLLTILANQLFLRTAPVAHQGHSH